MNKQSHNFNDGNTFVLSIPIRNSSLLPTNLHGTPVGQPKRGGNSWTRFRQDNVGLEMPELQEKYQTEKSRYKAKKSNKSSKR